MDLALHLLIGIVAIVGMFLLLVAPHEAGHMGAAKWFGVKVYEYAVGMGPRLLSTLRGGTVYALRLVPVGGFVHLAGMEEGDVDSPDGFAASPPWHRLAILIAGPLANFLVAALIITVVTLTQLNSDPGKIIGVYRSTPAYAQGVGAGDSIQSINGQPLTKESQLQKVELAHPDQPLQLGLRRANGENATVTIQPRYDAQLQHVAIGVVVAPLVNPGNALLSGVEFPFSATGLMVSGIATVVTGHVPGGLLGPNGLTGAVGIGYVTYARANQGILDWLQLAAFFSVALGVANLLPLPALDGGRMAVILIEKLRGRPFNRQRELAIQRAGLVALLTLMALVAILDVQRIATGEFAGLK
ncbi:MAG: M50 family metallopeptidase [Candidatus Dormibacteraceae bacterium]